MNTVKKAHLPEVSESAASGASAIFSSSADAVQMIQAVVVNHVSLGEYAVLIGGQQVNARVGAVLPELVAGDVVLLAQLPSRPADMTIVALLAAVSAHPFQDRPIEINSGQSVTLRSGDAVLKLTAQGVARLVALSIEHDARDLVDIDAAEVRIN